MAFAWPIFNLLFLVCPQIELHKYEIKTPAHSSTISFCINSPIVLPTIFSKVLIVSMSAGFEIYVRFFFLFFFKILVNPQFILFYFLVDCYCVLVWELILIAFYSRWPVCQMQQPFGLCLSLGLDQFSNHLFLARQYVQFHKAEIKTLVISVMRVGA